MGACAEQLTSFVECRSLIENIDSICNAEVASSSGC